MNFSPRTYVPYCFGVRSLTHTPFRFNSNAITYTWHAIVQYNAIMLRCAIIFHALASLKAKTEIVMHEPKRN